MSQNQEPGPTDAERPPPSGEDGGASGGRPRRTRIWRTLRDLCIGLFVAYWVGELLVVQIWGEQPKFPRRVVEAPWGLRYNAPGISYRHKSADVNIRIRTNQQGMRADMDYAYEKPEGTIRIVSLGDSFAMGYEVAHEQTYSSILEQELRVAGYDAQVLNAGVSGFSTAEEVLYLERELIKYDPDVVVVGFYYNDFADNMRTDLFGVGEDGRLVAKNDVYVPLGRIGNFLNSNPFFNFFSAYSNSFVLAKERATLFIKGLMVARSRGAAREAAERELEVPDTTRATGYRVPPYEKQLLVGLIERLYAFCHERDIDLVILSIPSGGFPGDGAQAERPLVDRFPYGAFDSDRPGLAILPMIEVLEPHYGEEELVHQRSHRHWTPFSHRLSGAALAKLVLDRGFIERRAPRPLVSSDRSAASQ